MVKGKKWSQQRRSRVLLCFCASWCSLQTTDLEKDANWATVARRGPESRIARPMPSPIFFSLVGSAPHGMELELRQTGKVMVARAG